MITKEAMVITVEQLMLNKVIIDLLMYNFFCNFPHLYYMRNWAVV